MHMGADAAHPPIRPIDFSVLDLDDDDSCNDSMPFVEVSTKEPFRILNASQQWLDVFQFSLEEVEGRTLRVACGPGTRIEDLNAVITTAANGKEGNAPVCFYSSVGTAKLMAVKAQPNETWEQCRLSMVPSDAVKIKDAIVMEDCARAIVSLQEPFTIQHVNATFCGEFGMKKDKWAGRTLRILHGPQTDCAELVKMLQAATLGLSQTQELIMYTSEGQTNWCEVSAVPVLSAVGVIGQLMVAFNPLLNRETRSRRRSGLGELEARLNLLSFPPADIAPTPCTVSPPAASSSPFKAEVVLDAGLYPVVVHRLEPSYAQPATRAPDPQQCFQFPADDRQGRAGLATVSASTAALLERYDPASNTLLPAPDAPASQPASLKLIPRKKRPASGEFVEITAERIAELGAKSMKAAAEELGIAPSTLKKCCRRLGVERWPSSNAAKSKALDYDGSYVRRLQAKYRPESASAAAADPPTACAPLSPVPEHSPAASLPIPIQTLPPTAARGMGDLGWEGGAGRHSAEEALLLGDAARHVAFDSGFEALDAMQW